MDPTLKTVIVICFIIAVAVILVFTIKDAILTWKAGLLKSSAYADDPIREDAAGTERPADSQLAIGDKDDDGHDYDGEDSEDYEDDEYEDDSEDYEDDEYEDDSEDEYEDD